MQILLANAADNWRRYQNFFAAEKLPAIMAYVRWMASRLTPNIGEEQYSHFVREN